jgi:hypothetical protein
MSRSRMWLVSGVILFIVVGQLYDTIRARENWPFSNYPMFSRLTEHDDFSRLVMRGVLRNGHEVELGDPSYSAPMEVDHVRVALEHAERSSDPVGQLQAVLRQYMTNYEARRKAGLHKGEPLRGIHVYLLRWRHIDPSARNAHRPDQSILIFNTLNPRRPPRVEFQESTEPQEGS